MKWMTTSGSHRNDDGTRKRWYRAAGRWNTAVGVAQESCECQGHNMEATDSHTGNYCTECDTEQWNFRFNFRRLVRYLRTLYQQCLLYEVRWSQWPWRKLIPPILTFSYNWINPRKSLRRVVRPIFEPLPPWSNSDALPPSYTVTSQRRYVWTCKERWTYRTTYILPHWKPGAWPTILLLHFALQALNKVLCIVHRRILRTVHVVALVTVQYKSP